MPMWLYQLHNTEKITVINVFTVFTFLIATLTWNISKCFSLNPVWKLLGPLNYLLQSVYVHHYIFDLQECRTFVWPTKSMLLCYLQDSHIPDWHNTIKGSYGFHLLHSISLNLNFKCFGRNRTWWCLTNYTSEVTLFITSFSLYTMSTENTFFSWLPGRRLYTFLHCNAVDCLTLF